MQNTDGALDHLDIRSLRLLSLLLQTRSVTRTADLLGISQPAASRALAALRRAAGDPLLVRAGAEQVLTPRAAELTPMVDAALAAVRGVFSPLRFDPASATGRIRIATTDYGAVVVAGPLAARLARQAPGLDLELQAWGPNTFERLAEGGLDVALYADAVLPSGVCHRDLFHDGYAVLMRRGHPLLRDVGQGGDLLPEVVAAWPQVVVLYPEGRITLADEVVLPSGGNSLRSPFRTPYFLMGAAVLVGTDYVMCLPSRAARHLALNPAMVAVPLAGDAGFDYRVIWHARAGEDPRMKWIRDQVAASASL